MLCPEYSRQKIDGNHRIPHDPLINKLPISKSTNPLINDYRSTDQQINKSTDQPINRLTNQLITDPLINKSTDQPINKSTDYRSTDQQIN